MTVHLVIRIGRDVLDSVSEGRPVVLGVSSEPAPASNPAIVYRDGSHPQRLLDWAERRGRDFDTSDVVRVLRVTRSHASMILNKVVKDTGPIRRISHGIYRFGDATPARKKKKKRKRKPGRKK